MHNEEPQQAMPVFEGTSTQPSATPADKKTQVAVAAVAHAEPVPEDFPLEHQQVT